jgi:hypothetical protein
MLLLARLGWRVRLDAQAHVGPCHRLLFGRVGTRRRPAVAAPQCRRLATPDPAEPALGATPAAAVPASQKAWAPHMRALCAAIKRQAQVVAAKSAHVASAPAAEASNEQPPDAKRQRAGP